MHSKFNFVFWNFLEFFFLDPQLVEYTDVEPADTEGPLYSELISMHLHAVICHVPLSLVFPANLNLDLEVG